MGTQDPGGENRNKDKVIQDAALCLITGWLANSAQEDIEKKVVESFDLEVLKISWKKFCNDPEVVGAKKGANNRTVSKTCFEDIKDTFRALDRAGHLPKIICDNSEI